MSDDEDRIGRLERITAARQAAQMATDATTLAGRMRVAAARREEQRERLDRQALDRPRNTTDDRIDAAVEQGDLRRLATMAEEGIIEPNDARLAADIVKYDHPENRTRSVWLADRAKTAARYSHRMDEIAEDASLDRRLRNPAANPEVHHRIGTAITDKLLDEAFERLLDWDDEDHAVKPPEPKLEDPEPDRPIERLARGMRI